MVTKDTKPLHKSDMTLTTMAVDLTEELNMEKDTIVNDTHVFNAWSCIVQNFIPCRISF